MLYNYTVKTFPYATAGAFICCCDNGPHISLRHFLFVNPLLLVKNFVADSFPFTGKFPVLQLC